MGEEVGDRRYVGLRAERGGVAPPRLAQVVKPDPHVFPGILPLTPHVAVRVQTPHIHEVLREASAQGCALLCLCAELQAGGELIEGRAVEAVSARLAPGHPHHIEHVHVPPRRVGKARCAPVHAVREAVGARRHIGERGLLRGCEHPQLTPRGGALILRPTVDDAGVVVGRVCRASHGVSPAWVPQFGDQALAFGEQLDVEVVVVVVAQAVAIPQRDASPAF